MLWMHSDAVYELVWLNLICTNSVDGREKWEFVFHALVLQHVVDFEGCDWTLQELFWGLWD